MRSKISSFNKGIYLFNLKRFWLIAFAFAFLLTLGIIDFLGIVSDIAPGKYSAFDSPGNAHLIFAHTDIPAILWFPFFSLIAALAMFSYIHHQRNTAMIHALPVTRNCLFTTHYLAGLTLVLLPLLISGVILVVGELLAGITHIGYSLLWILVSAVFLFLFYSFAVFAGMFTGHMAAHALYFFIFNFLAVFLEDVFETILSSLLFGYVAPGRGLFTAFSPIVYLVECFSDFSYGKGNWLVVACYLLVGLLFTWGARAVYLRRHMETAGDVVSVRIMKPVFKYSVAFCSSALLGNIIVVSLMNFGRGFTVFVVSYLIGGFIGYFAAEMLLRKTFRVFRKVKGFIAFALVIVVLLGAIHFDLFGYETYVPDVRDVEVMYLNDYFEDYAQIALKPESYNPERYGYFFIHSGMAQEPPTRLDEEMIHDLRQMPGVLERPETIEKAVALHKVIVRNASSLDNQNWRNNRYYGSPDIQAFPLSIVYRLKNGNIVERAYYLPYRKDNMGELETALQELVTSDEYMAKNNPLIHIDADRVNFIQVTFHEGETSTLNLMDPEDVEAFLDAFKKDIMESDPLALLRDYQEGNPTGIEITFNFKEQLPYTKDGGRIRWTYSTRTVQLWSVYRHTLEYLAGKINFSQEIWQKLTNSY